MCEPVALRLTNRSAIPEWLAYPPWTSLHYSCSIVSFGYSYAGRLNRHGSENLVMSISFKADLFLRGIFDLPGEGRTDAGGAEAKPLAARLEPAGRYA